LLDGNRPNKIIVIRDSEVTTTLLESSLAGNNFAVEVLNLHENWKASIRKYVPDVVIIDLGASITNGLNLCREIRMSSQVPILFLSVANKLDIEKQALAAGADKLLQKPVPAKILAAYLNALMRRAYAEKQATLAQQYSAGS